MLKRPALTRSCFYLTAMKLARDEAGGTAIEYSLIASTIAVAILSAVLSIGEHVVAIFHAVAVATALH